MSDWKESAAKRRDARHGGPIKVRPARAKKDRKRWCRGKEGIEHKPKARSYDDAKGGAPVYPSGRALPHTGWWLLVCEECGKELDFWFGSKWTTRPPPEWVPTPVKRTEQDQP